ncbi:MAG: DUF6049 family protein [Acidimicrobiales bacterium]
MATLTRSIHRPHSRTAIALALVIAVSGAVSVPTSAAAQGSSTLELVAQSSWVDDGGIFSLQVRIAGADPDSTIAVEVFPAYPSAAAFVVDDLTNTEPILRIGPQPLAELQDTSNEVISWQIAVAGPTTDQLDDDDSIPVLRTEGESAVYPLQVTLSDSDGNATNHIRTSLIELPRDRSFSPLQVVVLLGTDVPLGTAPDGTHALPAEAGAGLVPIVEALELHPDAEVGLSLSPESIVALQTGTSEQIALIERLAEALAPSAILAGPYVEVDEQAWVDAELEDELGSLYDSGLEAVRIGTGSEATESIAVLDPSIDSSGLDWLATRGVQGVIARSAQLERLDADMFAGSTTRRFLVPTSTSATVPALQADSSLARHFRNERPIHSANRLLAHLTLLALESSDSRRSAVVITPEEWQPDLKFLNVMLSGLERIPVLRATAAGDALANTDFLPASGVGTISPPLRRSLEPGVVARALGSYRTDLNQASSVIESWRSVVATEPEATHIMTELLRVSAAKDLDPLVRTAYIDTIYRLIDEQKDDAIATAEAETITLTGREATVPIVLENQLDVRASVLLVVDSEKLSFPEGREIHVVLEPGSNRVEIPIEALASGDSPIRVQILSPDRSVLLGTSEVLVRTFAFSGVGIVVGVAAILVLLAWWLRHRRSARGTLPPVDTPPRVSAPPRSGVATP